MQFTKVQGLAVMEKPSAEDHGDDGVVPEPNSSEGVRANKAVFVLVTASSSHGLLRGRGIWTSGSTEAECGTRG